MKNLYYLILVQSYTIKDTAQGNGTTIGSTASALRANEDYTPLTPKVIKSGATHTVQLDVTFTSTNSYLSPVIDMERCSMITVGNRIDNQIYRALTGSINPTASTSVTGVNTLFTSELRVGNRILVSGEERTVATITSNTALTVTAHLQMLLMILQYRDILKSIFLLVQTKRSSNKDC